MTVCGDVASVAVWFLVCVVGTPFCQIYSVNEGNWTSFDAPTKRFIEGCKAAKKPYVALSRGRERV